MSDHLRATQEANEAMRRPITPVVVIGRIGLAAATYFIFGRSAPDVIVMVWGLLWAASLGRDVVFGIAPMQGVLGCLLDTGKWIAFAAVVLTSILSS